MTELLETTYNKVLALDVDWPIEDFIVVKLVEDYRNYWKPKEIKTILLAESHVYTEKNLIRTRHCLNISGYPKGYVRFVYNLAYGQSNILNEPLDKNTGTHQFWNLFNQIVDKNFQVTNNPNAGSKLKEKISLLKYMKKSGIWLLDCSIVAVYKNKEKPSKNDYNKILDTSFQNYCEPIIEECNPNNIIVVGKTVYDLVIGRLSNKGYNIVWIHQPNAIISSSKRRGIANTGI
ncbi:hypothetical protein SAMN06265375_101436 [Muriicola jejuensis]|uniref:Uracil-DNA glycosylase-like domain-containing protein n=1 Tax=Muriicola jejuensis TaxID=504488 RepID=A0A6P0UFL6_9FLAO|nr:hypothetical protein [Muriicola jejuensis]NER10033.1 hypothetical protein [Muriicola jejuensis]SMP03588.1 hypothetical protein SAMN06265375_101436 [Muriicola jejuensis]